MSDFPMTGAGLFIHKLQRCMPDGKLDALIAACMRANVKWLCIKVADGIYEYNTIAELGGTQGLKEKIDILKDAGLRVGGWQWVYTSNKYGMSKQVEKLGERYQKLGLEFLQLDVEHNDNVNSLWKTWPNRNNDAKTFVNNLRAVIPLTVPIGLCSYRYPVSLHWELPYSAFLQSDSVMVCSPQVYWASAHNSGEQLIRSYDEWDNWIGKWTSFVPFGAAYEERGWSPTAGEIAEFVSTCKSMGFPGYGFWVADYAMYRPEYLDAIADGVVVPPPDPEPDPEPEPVTRIRVKKFDNPKDTLRLRSAPWGEEVGKVYQYKEFDVVDTAVDSDGKEWYAVKAYVAGWHCDDIS